MIALASGANNVDRERGSGDEAPTGDQCWQKSLTSLSYYFSTSPYILLPPSSLAKQLNTAESN